MATRLEQEYENTIQLYIKNGYQVVSENNNTTIMFAAKLFQKYANDMSRRMTANASIASVGDAYGGRHSAASATTAWHSASANAHSTANIQKSNYEVAIRMTKTGKVDVSGFTLEKLSEYMKNQQKQEESTAKVVAWLLAILLGMLVGTIVFVVYGAVTRIAVDDIPIPLLICFVIAVVFSFIIRRMFDKHKTKLTKRGK